MPQADVTKPIARPESCPFCHSKSVGTLAKVISASTYWRCQACGGGWSTPRPGEPVVRGQR